MAVTSLWHVKGSIKDVIDYIENPEKTVPNQDMQDFFDVFSYVKNPLKTNEGEYVSAVNCLKETALQQMILTKKQYQMILSRLVDTFSSRILYPMLLLSGNHSIAAVLSWEEGLH